MPLCSPLSLHLTNPFPVPRSPKGGDNPFPPFGLEINKFIEFSLGRKNVVGKVKTTKTRHYNNKTMATSSYYSAASIKASFLNVTAILSKLAGWLAGGTYWPKSSEKPTLSSGKGDDAEVEWEDTMKPTKKKKKQNTSLARPLFAPFEIYML